MGISDDVPERYRRGQRVKALREGMGLSGDEFAARLNDAAKKLGHEPAYDKFKVSNTENGRRDLSAEDMACLESVDPEHRDFHWWAFGRALPTVAPVRRRPKPDGKEKRG